MRPRSLLRRLLSALLAPWLAISMAQSTPWHTCTDASRHSAVASMDDHSAHAHAGHADHAEHAAPAAHGAADAVTDGAGSGPERAGCDCADCCCCLSPAAETPRANVLAVVPASLRDARPRPATGAVARVEAPPHLRPFAIGPPARV
ncbi:MAG: hypothetical protein MUE41_07930 [Gemmatimonadaceae bacterium]|nr:hypothetical protein [Gemmatimonadaceae bacterium]